MFSERLNQFIEYIGESPTSFEPIIGVAKGTIYKAIKNGKTVGTQVLEKIVSFYPLINLEWLITGKGSMLKDSNILRTENENVHLNSTPNSTPNTKSKEIGVQNIVTALREPRDDYGLVRVDIVDVRAAANFVGISMHDGPIETLGSVALSSKMLQRGKIHKCFPVMGDSMAPTIKPGDHIVARFLEKSEYQNIRNGYVHIISTVNGIVVKRLLNRLAERGHLWARSDNRDYIPYAIEQEDIVSVWEVKAKITFQLDDEQADIRAGYDELRARMEEIEYLLKHHKR